MKKGKRPGTGGCLCLRLCSPLSNFFDWSVICHESSLVSRFERFITGEAYMRERPAFPFVLLQVGDYQVRSFTGYCFPNWFPYGLCLFDDGPSIGRLSID